MTKISVPDTDTFSLQHIYDSVNSHASPTQDLLSCFSNAEDQFFDPQYNDADYAPANSMLRFRNYNPNPIAFVGVSSNGPYAITEDARTIAVDILGDLDNSETRFRFAAYDPYYKVLICADTDLNWLWIIDFSQRPVRAKGMPMDSYVGSVGWISFTNNYWFFSDGDNNKVYYRYRASYDSFTSPGSVATGVVNTTGRIRHIQYYSGKYYYATGNGEIGYFSSMGSPSVWNQLHDSDTVDFKWIGVGGSKVLGFDDNNDGRYALRSSDTSWSNFDLDSSINSTVRYVLPYGTTYSIVQTYYAANSSSRVYYVYNYSSTPTGVEITPSGMDVWSIAVDGTDIYCSAQSQTTGTWYILKKTSVSGSWTQVDTDEGTPLPGFPIIFKY